MLLYVLYRMYLRGNMVGQHRMGKYELFGGLGELGVEAWNEDATKGTWWNWGSTEKLQGQDLVPQKVNGFIVTGQNPSYNTSKKVKP